MHHTRRHRQRGSVIITVCLLTLFLLGFIGFALDFGRLFIVKTELQTAMDACALAAAQELDSLPTSIDRGRSAGMTAGNLNAVNLQSADWGGKPQLIPAEITFKKADYADTADPIFAQYAKCQHVQPAVTLWLLQAMGAFTSNATLFPNTQDVMASAVATRASSQTTCPVPLALKPEVGFEADKANNYGFDAGQWITLLMAAGSDVGNGEIGWANLDGSNDANEAEKEMNGKCGTEPGQKLGTPGVKEALADTWNWRFGIYKNSVSIGTPTTHNPDYSGYVYTEKNWPAKANAYYGDAPDPVTPETATSENFDTKRGSFASCADTSTDIDVCASITGLSFKAGGFKVVAAPGTTADGGHKTHGRARRTVIVPVVNPSDMTVIDFACMLMLQPITSGAGGGMNPVDLEFIGLAGNPGVPCVTNGMPGGWAGPLVPQLVR